MSLNAATGAYRGPRGYSVLSGASAPTGSDGADGDWWISTTDPATIYGPKAGGTWPAGVQLPGSSIVTGTGSPSAGDGRDDDMYLDTSSMVMYGPKAGGSWPSAGTSLVGLDDVSTVLENGITSASVYDESAERLNAELLQAELDLHDVLFEGLENLRLLIYRLIERRTQILSTGLNSAVTANATRYLLPTYAESSSDVMGWIMTSDRRIRNLRVKCTTAPGGTQTTTVTVLVDGVLSTVSARLSGSSTTASDTTNSAYAPSGSRVSVSCVNSATAATATLLVSFEAE